MKVADEIVSEIYRVPKAASDRVEQLRSNGITAMSYRSPTNLNEIIVEYEVKEIHNS